MPLILGTNSIKDTTFNVANSCRFDTDASMTKTSSTGSNTKSTFSAWVKRSKLGAEQKIFNFTGGSNNFNIEFKSTDILAVSSFDGASQMNLRPTRVFRDVSAWYHIVAAIDTTQSTAANRVKIYVNGVQESSFGTETYPAEDDTIEMNGRNSTNPFVGQDGGDDKFFNGYLAELVWIDGSQLAADQFGEFDSDSGIWKPINVSGLTFGTNGFYLDFEDSSNLGNDANGGTDLGETNIAATDQSTDTCTNNFATMNSIDNVAAGSAFSEGNLKIVTTSGNITYNTSTIGFSSGKWYMETKLAGSAGYTVGVVRGVSTANDNDNKLGNRADGFSYDDGGEVENNGGTLTGSFASYSSGDIIGVYADLDNNELYFSKDGALQNSGTGLTLTAGTYFFAVGDNNASNSSTYEVNFGGTNTYSVSSGNTDGTYGNFEYSTTITGDGASKTFKALNTKNLAEYG